jgi:delta24-sterol reductase
LEEAVKVFTEESVKQEGNEFVEGLMFELNKGVIMTGNMVKNLKAGDKVSTFFLKI